MQFFYDNYDLSDVINELNSARFYLGELNENILPLNYSYYQILN